MATTLVKGLAAVGALGTASGVGTLVYLNTRDLTTIADKLSQEGLTKITKQDDYKFHLFDTKNHQKLNKLLGLTKIDHKEHVSNLEQWCTENLRKNVSEDKDNSIFDNAKAFCVAPTIRTLGQKVKGNFYLQTEWSGKYDVFVKGENKANFKKALKVDFPDVDFEQTVADGGEKLKKWCENTSKINTYDVNEDRLEKNFGDWCIKPST